MAYATGICNFDILYNASDDHLANVCIGLGFTLGQYGLGAEHKTARNGALGAEVPAVDMHPEHSGEELLRYRFRSRACEARIARP